MKHVVIITKDNNLFRFNLLMYRVEITVKTIRVLASNPSPGYDGEISTFWTDDILKIEIRESLTCE